MKTPTYTQPAGQGTLTFGYNCRFKKWAFKTELPDSQPMTYLFPCHGAEQGHKVANAISGSFKRKGELDGLGRATIKKILGS